MRLVKKINNNFVLAMDSAGEQLIVEGKGIGFLKLPCDLQDYSIITRTYYDFDNKYLDLLSLIPPEILSVANAIYDYLKSHLNCPLNPNLPFILADHISFSVERYHKQMTYVFPMYNDLRSMYPLEYKASCLAIELVSKELNISLPESEKAGIMLNIINAEMNLGSVHQGKVVDDWVMQFTRIIESHLHVQISKDGFNFSRFVSHINYMYRRVMNIDESLEKCSDRAYRELADGFPYDRVCVEEFADYLKQKYQVTLSNAEKFYLILHVNRLCRRELT